MTSARLAAVPVGDRAAQPAAMGTSACLSARVQVSILGALCTRTLYASANSRDATPPTACNTNNPITQATSMKNANALASYSNKRGCDGDGKRWEGLSVVQHECTVAKAEVIKARDARG
eukprot:6180485-Pleurochrysis_carterae.AAC.14